MESSCPCYYLLFLHAQHPKSFPLSDLIVLNSLYILSSLKPRQCKNKGYASSTLTAVLDHMQPEGRTHLQSHQSRCLRSMAPDQGFLFPKPIVGTWYQSSQHKWVDSSKPEPHLLLSLHLWANCSAPQPSLESLRTVTSQNKRHNGR